MPIFSHLDFAGSFVFFGVALGLIYWVLQAFLDAYIFGSGNLTKYIFSPNSYEIWIRSMVIFMFILSSVFAQSMISKRKRAEEALRNNEEMLRATIESSGNGVLVVDGNGRVVHSNNRFIEMWRIPEELVKAGDDDKLLEFVLDQLIEPQQFIKKVKELYNSPNEDRDTLIFKNGCVFERFSRPLVKDKTIAGRVWSFTDITDREQVNSKLKLTQFSIDHAVDAIYWVGPDARFIYANETAARILGYSHEELCTMSVYDIDPDLPKDGWPQHWRELKQRGSFTFKSRHKTKDGIIFPVEISVNFIEFAGKEYNCALARKITEDIQVEDTHDSISDKQEITKI
jgi:PAS domain S-box-containing protein